MCTVYCPVPSSKHCVVASEPEKKTVHALLFPLFRELRGSWIYRLRIRSGPSEIKEGWKNTVCLLFFFRFRAQNTALWLQNRKKTVHALYFALFRELGGSWIDRLRIRSGPSKIREKWKTQCVYCLFSGSELKTLCCGFRTGKKTVNTLCFPLFREFGGSWI